MNECLGSGCGTVVASEDVGSNRVIDKLIEHLFAVQC